MDLKAVEELVKEKGLMSPNLVGGGDGGDQQIDPSIALKSFLDHIPISSIVGTNRCSQVLELKPNDSVRDAIHQLYTKNASGAPIVDIVSSLFGEFVDRDIGFIEFSSMVLWSLEELNNVKGESKNTDHGLLSMLEEVSHIGQTKIGELAKSFLWEPFFPIRSEDTLFHALLLFSKHPRLKVAPVVESSNSRVVSFVTQNAVVQLLLQSSGLQWFDQIAEKPLSEFGFENSGRTLRVFADQSIAESFHILWEKETDGVPVVNRENGVLVGNVRCSDVHLLLDDDNSFKNRKSTSVEEFIKFDAKTDQSSGPSTKGEICAFGLKNNSLPRMSSLIINQSSDSLKQAMEKLVVSKNDRSFLVNKSRQLVGVVTLRDIISQFSPPSLYSRIDGGGFFMSALEQTGCHVENGSLVRNA